MIAWDPTEARRLIAEAREDAGLVRAIIEAGPEHVDDGERLADQLEAAIGEIERLTQERDDAWAAHETVSGWWKDAADRAARQIRELESLRAQHVPIETEIERIGREVARMQPVVDAAERWAPSVRAKAMHARMPKIELDLYHAAVAYRASKAGT